MILSTILLLSPTLSPLALQQAEPQVIIRRQGVESAPQRVRVRVHPEHSHGEHPQQLAEVQDLETEMLALELATLEAELGELERQEIHTELARQEPGQGESHARIVIRFGDGREEVMEWAGQEGDLHHELSAMLSEGSGHGSMIFLNEQAPECGECEEVSSCEEIVSCEASECEDEDEIILSWAAPAPSAGAWTTDSPRSMAFGGADLNFGCDCEGCPLSSQRMQAARQMSQRQVIRLGGGQAPMAQGHAQAHREPARQTQSGHGFSFHAAPPQRVEQHQMRMPMPPTPPMPPQGMRHSGGVTQRVDHLEQRLDRIEAMLAELLERR